ncbi:MAG: DUF4815 domain-containing protein, partial [Micrococcales bacterium]|nr:DUF4815 domain-containing protein [Micrococcales bacterium]
MSYDPTLFNVDPYYDDFNEDKKFLRIMFKPGYALQAREVTQLQTILQNQIERFGSNIFENGSVVLDGQITENYLRYGRITGLSGVSSVTGLVGAVVGAVGSAQARIVHAEAGLSSSTIDPFGIVYFDYVGGGSGLTTNTTISGTAGTNSVSFSLSGNSTVSALGDSAVISVNSGVRFIDGYFVMHDAQMIGAYSVTGATGAQYRVHNNPTTRIGFATNPSFVTATDDETLNDPAFGYYNYAAPGADRFKLDLTLTQYGFDPTAVTTTTNFARGDFTEIIRIVNGQTVKKELYPQYAVIEDTLARRTYDESGNYTVEPFDLNMTYRNVVGGAAGATLSAELGQGKAYIFGYEFETQGTTVLTLPRARGAASTATYTDQRSIGSIGPSLLVTPGGSANSLTGFDLSTNPTVFLSDGAVGATFNNIGTAKIRALVPQGTVGSSNYKAYIYDIALTGSYSLTAPTRIFMAANAIQGGATAQQAFNINWNGATGVLGDVNDSGLLFTLPKGDRVSTVSGVNYAILNIYKVAIGANGAGGSIATNNGNHTYAIATSAPFTTTNPTVDFFVLSTTGAPVGFTASFASSSQFTLTANAANQNVYVISTTDIGSSVGSSVIRRNKTLVTETLSAVTGSFQVDSLGKNFLYVGKGATSYVDVVSVSSITGTLNGTSNTQLLNYFTLDNGQRDNYYDWSRLILSSSVNPGTSTGVTGNFDITLTRFVHSQANASSATGPFTVDSYLSQSVDYKDIPVYISPTTGRSYRLSDVLDFRPVRQNDGTFSGYVLPAQSPSVSNDNKFTYSAYLPRTDKIVLGRDRNFKVLTGIPSVNPQPPEDNPDAMTLYTVTLNGYTTTKDDVQIKRVENKRYTMQDIANLEDRLDNVEYYSNLNILEQQVRNSPILDSAGLEIPKKGILVDGFRGHAVSDVQDPMYAAAIDFENAEMRPSFRNRVYRLNQVSASSVSGSSDGIYTLGYITTPLINQPLATSSLNVNPAGVFNYLGFMRSTPSSDFWYDDTTAPVVRINTEGENDAWLFGVAAGTGPGEAKGFGSQWNDWESNWSGIARNNISTSAINSDPSRSIFVSSAGSRLTQPSANNQILPNSLVSNIGDLQVKSDIIPYARSIAVGLSASNLRPNTGLYLFVDGIGLTPASGGGGITSDVAGNASVNFTIPLAAFAAGKKNIRLTDSATNDLTSTTTAADYIFPAQGIWGNVKDGIITTRTVQTRRESVRSEKVVTNIFSKDVQRSGFTKLLGFTDPLSQSFYIDPAIYPSGIFAKKVTLYFKSKDSNSNTPISMVLRPVINGYPHPSKFIPLSDSTILSSAITTSTDASAGTDFTFTSPVYLAPGEYAFSLVTPSNNFEIFTSQVGMDVLKQTSTESTVRASKQPYARSLFKNQTSTGVQKTDTEDAKFLLHICNFSSSASFTLGAAGAAFYGSGILNAHAVRYNVPNIVPSNTTLSTTESGLVGSSVNLNKTSTTSTTTFTGANNGFTTLTFTMSTSDPYVSPVIDMDRANANIIENKIADVSLAGSTNETSSTQLGATVKATARYITKRVVLEPGMEATNLRVELLASYPQETTFKVYARMSPENGTG